MSGGVQTDGSSVVLPGIATLNDGKVDLVADHGVRWYIDHNAENIDRATGLPVGTLRIPSFLKHRDRFIDSRAILHRTAESAGARLAGSCSRRTRRPRRHREWTPPHRERAISSRPRSSSSGCARPGRASTTEKLAVSQILQESYWKRTKGAVRSALESSLALLERYGLAPEMGHKEVGGPEGDGERRGGLRRDHGAARGGLEVRRGSAGRGQRASRSHHDQGDLPPPRPGGHLHGQAHGRRGRQRRAHPREHHGRDAGWQPAEPVRPGGPRPRFPEPAGLGRAHGPPAQLRGCGAVRHGLQRRLQPAASRASRRRSASSPPWVTRWRFPRATGPCSRGWCGTRDSPLATRFEIRAPNPHTNTYPRRGRVRQAMLDGMDLGCGQRPVEQGAGGGFLEEGRRGAPVPRAGPRLPQRGGRLRALRRRGAGQDVRQASRHGLGDPGGTGAATPAR